jgi:hypothetical protein
MDHLPAVSRRSENIPYLGMGGDDSYSYNNDGFYLFPDKKGQSVRALLRGNAPNLEQRARESFFQAWLYFGLLDEFITWKENETIRAEDFYRFEGGLPVLSTALLLEYLELWRDDMLHMPESTRRSRQMRATVVLRDAKMIISERIANASPQSGWYIDRRLSTSFMILGETLSWAMQQLEIHVGASIAGWTGHLDDGWGPSSLVFDRLREQGWCPYSISMLRGMLKNNVSGLYYASTYPTSPDQRLGLNHNRCTDRVCSAKYLVDGRYEMRHVMADCTCSFIGPNVRDVLRVLDSDGIPLLYYQGSFESGNAKLQVKKFEQGMKYVVISHVWADGLGNPEGNGMVTCQIQRLTQLAGKLLDFSGGPVFFWIDTLLIPTDEQYKAYRKKAIRQMHDIYAKAYKTIVLDGDLVKHRVGPDYIETAMRITICGWMQRLWTLQEGVMSRSIYFLFQNGLQDIEDLDLNYPAAAARSSVAGAARAFYSNLLRPHNLVDHVDTKRISAMWKAMQWRQTAKSDDETMAVATILNVDPEELVNCNEENRMMVLLKNMPEIPSAFIFLPGRRLTMKGFRWAPATWMGGWEIDFPDPLALPSKPKLFSRGYDIVQAPSVLTKDGLMVRYPGYRLHTANLTDAVGTIKNSTFGFGSFVFPSTDSLHEWYQVTPVSRNEAENYFRFLQDELATERLAKMPRVGDYSAETIGLAIILCRPNPGVTPEVALLVQRQLTKAVFPAKEAALQNSAIKVESAIRVWIKLLTQDISEEPAPQLEQLKHSLKSSNSHGHVPFWGEEIKEDQLWVVD